MPGETGGTPAPLPELSILLATRDDARESSHSRLAPRKPIVEKEAVRSLLPILAASLAFLPIVRAVDPPPSVLPPEAPVFNHARLYPVAAREKMVVGGKFCGSNVSATEGFETLAEIKEAPAPETWVELVFNNKKLYRWLRYEAPAGSFGSVGELEFLSGNRKLDGQKYATIGERNGRGWRFAFDGDPKTWVDTELSDGQYAGLDLLEQATGRVPKFLPSPNGVQQALKLYLSCLTPYATIRYTLDGTMPTATTGEEFRKDIPIDKTTTVVAASFVQGWATSPPIFGTFIIGPETAPGLSTLHIGNNLTDTTTQFATYARTAGRPHQATRFTVPGASTNRLWELGLAERKRDWEVASGVLNRVDHVTVQPRDFDVAREADFDKRFFDLVRKKSPKVQPWLFAEWVERERRRPSDLGLVPSSQMKKTWPALTWEESMGAMLLYVEEVQRKLGETDPTGPRVKVLPTNLALGWLRNRIESGQFPGLAKDAFYPRFFYDSVHPNPNGSYLVDLTWYAAFYGESPEGKVLPVGTSLSPEQAVELQRLAWEVVKNYPGAGLYEEGQTAVGAPEFSPAPEAIKDLTPVTISSATPGTWFRYTLDGTEPTRTNGYLYCGVVTMRPGLTLRAIGFQSGMADSHVNSATYPERK